VLETLVLAAALAAPTCVDAVPGASLDTADDPPAGAVGLVVPDAGPRTSERRAVESLLRGEVVNSLRDRLPSDPRLLELCPDSDWKVGVPAGGDQRNDRRYLITLEGARGLLASTATRIPGLVAIADIAHGRVRVEDDDDPLATLRELDDRIRDNGTARLPASVLAALIVVGFALWRPRAAVSALATGALANLLLGVLGVSSPWIAIPAIALGTAAGLLVPTTGVLLAGTIALYGLAMAIEPAWVALSPLGPTQNARFHGISNLLETMLLPVALASGALLWRRYGTAGLAVAAAIALVTVAGSRFGADAGGAVVLLAGFAVLAVSLLPRRTALAALGALVLVTALALVLGPSTHLGAADLPGDLWDRLVLSWERATDGVGVGLVTAAAMVTLVVLVWRWPARPLPLAMAAAIAVSMLVNDSPQDVALGGLVGWLALARWDGLAPVPFRR
jgi:hypothetical protein